MLCGATGCGNTPQPPPPFFIVRTTYANAQGQDLLNQSLPNSFRQPDLDVFTRVERNGAVIVEYYNEDDKGISVYFDGTLNASFFYLSIPTNFDKNPIETIIKLSPTDSDTVTYTFNPSKLEAVPDRIFYNDKLVWEVFNVPQEGQFPPIRIVK